MIVSLALQYTRMTWSIHADQWEWFDNLVNATDLPVVAMLHPAPASKYVLHQSSGHSIHIGTTIFPSTRICLGYCLVIVIAHNITSVKAPCEVSCVSDILSCINHLIARIPITRLMVSNIE